MVDLLCAKRHATQRVERPLLRSDNTLYSLIILMLESLKSSRKLVGIIPDFQNLSTGKKVFPMKTDLKENAQRAVKARLRQFISGIGAWVRSSTGKDDF